jgi:hypothetical protein
MMRILWTGWLWINDIQCGSQGYPPDRRWGSYEQADTVEATGKVRKICPGVDLRQLCRDGAPGKNDGSRSLFNVDEGTFLPPPSTRWWGSRRVIQGSNLILWGRDSQQSRTMTSSTSCLLTMVRWRRQEEVSSLGMYVWAYILTNWKPTRKVHFWDTVLIPTRKV